MVCYVRRKMPHNQNRILTHTRLCHSIVPKPINPKVYHPLASCCPYAPSVLSACPSVCSKAHQPQSLSSPCFLLPLCPFRVERLPIRLFQSPSTPKFIIPLLLAALMPLPC